tara:strand:+ start:519 stop:1121 length:603 start_codon:yes stop_codon:yes gene_type:complete
MKQYNRRYLYNGSLIVYQRKSRNLIQKKYIYPYQNENIEIHNRLLGWEELSKLNSSIIKLDIKSYFYNKNGLNVEIHQEYSNRIPHQKGEPVLKYLDELRNNLNKAWEEGLVHGDLNRKNILLTNDGYRIIDIEPLLKIPLQNGKFVLRTTNPYLAEEDRKNWTISQASDQHGFDCFAAWIRGEVEQPAMASPPPHLPPL